MNGKVIAITQFVTAADVMQALQCSRSTAYEHLRRAAGRLPGDRGMLRVAMATWERYAERTFGGVPTRLKPSGVASRGPVEQSPIRITRPRRPRKQ